MAKFKVLIDLDGDAFHWNGRSFPGPELDRLLDEIRQALRASAAASGVGDGDGGRLLDMYGNDCGRWRILLGETAEQKSIDS